MYYELALISVAVGGAYWGFQFIRQDSLRVYGALNVIAAILATLGYIGQRGEETTYGIAGAIGVGAGACLLVLGPLARGFARRAAGSERFGLAQGLLGVADVLSPGSGVGDEKALLAAMREIRDGNIERTVQALTQAKHGASPEARLAIDERIAMLYLAAYRWDEAIAHAEAHLFDAIPPLSGTQPAMALRRVLGLSPPVWVELLGAYAYMGNHDQAARMLARLEDVCAGRPDAGIWVHRGRLVFLALSGRIAAVKTLVEPRRSRHMKAAARSYWLGVAHDRHGDAAAADLAYAKARSKSRGRPRQLIDQAIEKLRTNTAVELGPTATEVVTRVEAEPLPVVVDPARPRRRWAVRVLLVAMIAVSLLVTFLLGPSTDVGVLVRDGALVHSLVDEGEWWRLITASFIHVGGIHLLNLVGLWLIGRLAEDIFGPWRTLAIFAIAGVTGCVASYLASPASIAAGASGAMFGLLGAVFVELTIHKKRHRGWPRGMWGSLALVTFAQVGIGFLYPFIDQWAHGGGLVAGALVSVVLSPSVGWSKWNLHASRAIAIAFVLVAGYAAVMVVRTPVEESLTRSGFVQHDLGSFSVTAPASWATIDDELLAPDLFVDVLATKPKTLISGEAGFPEWVKAERERAKAKGFDQITDAKDIVVPLPAGWQGSELALSVPDSLGAKQQYRVVMAARADGTSSLYASIYVPETIARWMPRFFTNLLASIRAR